MRHLALAAALAALLPIGSAPGQALTASPEALSLEALAAVIPSPEALGAPATPERAATVTVAPELSQVDFRLMRVVSEAAYASSPEAYERVEARTPDGQEIALPVEARPLMSVSALDHAVVRQDRFGLYHLDVFFRPEDAAAYADITAGAVGQRVLWTSRGSILVDLLVTGRDTSGGFSIFYGDSPLERIENVLRILQVPYTVEVAEDLIVPETRADELRLEAMRALELQRRDAAIEALMQSLREGGDGWPHRPRVLFVLGGLFAQRGNFDAAIQCFEEIRNRYPDFPDQVPVLMALRDVHRAQGNAEQALAMNRAIVERLGGRGEEAIEAQRQVVMSLWSAAAASPEARQATQRLMAMLQETMAGLTGAERFPYELDLMSCQIRLGDLDGALRTGRARLANLPASPSEATGQMLMLCDLLLRAGHAQESLALLEEFAAAFETQHDVESDQIQPLWDQIQAAKRTLEGAIGSPSPLE